MATNAKHNALSINSFNIKLLLNHNYNIQFIIDSDLTEWYDIDLETLNIMNDTYDILEYIFMIFVFHQRYNHVQLLLDSGKFDINMYNCDPVKTALLNCDQKMIELLASYGTIKNDFNINYIDNLQHRIDDQIKCIKTMNQVGVPVRKNYIK